MNDEDQLTQLWKKLGQELKEAEADLDARKAAVEAKRAKFKLLDEARALILSEVQGGLKVVLGDATLVATATVLPSLQEAVRRYVCESRSDEGLSAGDVTKGLKGRGYGAGKGRGFYASVYVSLLRLAEKGEISVLTTPKGRRFARPEDQTRPLFAKIAAGGMQ
jgi:hypothetical protein